MDTGGNIYTMEIGKCLSFPAPESCFLRALLWAMRLGGTGAVVLQGPSAGAGRAAQCGQMPS